MPTTNDEFARVFGSVPVITPGTTNECTTLTLYVKPCGIMSKKPPLGLVNYDKQGDAVRKEKLKHTPKNTIAAYTPKALEFRGFCTSLYGKAAIDQLVTPDKLFGFLFYQAHRRKFVKKRETGYFDRADYDDVISKVDDDNDLEEHDVVGSQAIQQYLGAIRNIFTVQKRQGHVQIEAEALMTDRLKDLLKLVVDRKERVLVGNCKERVDGEFDPFVLVDKVPNIEEEMWQVSAIRELRCCVVMELDQVDDVDIRATGNWRSDVFGSYYDVSS